MENTSKSNETLSLEEIVEHFFDFMNLEENYTKEFADKSKKLLLKLLATREVANGKN